MNNFNTYFKRQIELWGEETQHALQQKQIAIIGCGGLGSSLALALGASGIGRIDLIDFDRVDTHNIHRQIAFTLDDCEKHKAQVVSDLIQKRSPFVHSSVFPMPFEEYAKENRACDLLIDATDNLPTREAIDNYAHARQIPWLYGSVEEFNGQVCFFEQSRFNTFVINDRKPGGIAAPIVMHIASLQANLALRYLAGLPIEKDRLHYLFFEQKSGQFVIKKFKMPI
jgi:adenylyltransferase/sulfurtransferase